METVHHSCLYKDINVDTVRSRARSGINPNLNMLSVGIFASRRACALDCPLAMSSIGEDHGLPVDAVALIDQIKEWIGAWGKAAAKLDSLDADTAYWDWLRDMIGQWDGFGTEDVETDGIAKLGAFKATSKATYGHRQLEAPGIRDTMTKLIIQSFTGGWRDYDRAQICVLLPECNQDFLIDFHYRAGVLHLAMCYFYSTSRNPTPGLIKMSSSIPFRHHGQLHFVKAFALSLQNTHGMKQAVKPHYLSIVLQNQEKGASFGDELNERVKALCPELAAQMLDWKQLKQHTLRITPGSYAVVTDYMKEKTMSSPPILQEHLKYFFAAPTLQHAGKDFLTELEQPHAISRYLHHVGQVAVDSGIDFSDENFASQVARKVKDAFRKDIVLITRKFFSGLSAAREANNADYNTKDIRDRFYTGEFDNIIKNTHDPQLTARYWSFVKEHDAKLALCAQQDQVVSAQQERTAVEHEIADLEKQAKEAAVEGDEAVEKTKKESLAKLASKLQEAQKLQFKVWHSKESNSILEMLKSCEEVWSKRQEERMQEDAIADSEEYMVMKKTHQGSKYSCAFAENSHLHQLLPSANPPVFIFDTAFAQFQAHSITAALRAAGRTGVVILIFCCTPPNIGASIASEKSLLSGIDLETIWSTRLFLTWKEFQGIGSAVLLANQDEDNLSPLLRRVLASDSVSSTGALYNLPRAGRSEMVIGNQRRHLLPSQKGRAFYEMFLRGVGILTADHVSGSDAIDVCFVEADGGVGELLEFVIEMRHKHAHKVGKQVDAGQLAWAASFGAPSENASSACSLVAREQHCKSILERNQLERSKVAMARSCLGSGAHGRAIRYG